MLIFVTKREEDGS